MCWHVIRYMSRYVSMFMPRYLNYVAGYVVQSEARFPPKPAARRVDWDMRAAPLLLIARGVCRLLRSHPLGALRVPLSEAGDLQRRQHGAVVQLVRHPSLSASVSKYDTRKEC
mmetsp:Transcript_8195/g.16209  ORF Transcript_8195/g.16209 Transcript_8195/m.16209 type:complete len:113 (+) Transcript_8195:105-443(+)